MEPVSEIFLAAPDEARRAALLDLAARGPVNRVVLPSGAPIWLVTGNAEARLALTEPRLVRGRAGIAYFRELPEIAETLQGHLLNRNPPDHTRLRKLITAAFTRRRIEALAPRIEDIAAGLIEEMGGPLDRGDVVDLQSAYAFPLPFRVISALLGIPLDEEKHLSAWFTVLAAGPAGTLSDYAAASDNLLRFLRDFIAVKRRNPGDDLASALIHARDGEDRLTENELIAMISILFGAGHETTTSLIMNSVLALLRHPDQLAILRERPVLVDSAVEEVLRYDSVLQATFPARATETFELGGQLIEAGEVVAVSPMTAGLDGRVTADPDRFDITREASHLAFGHGIHYCVGAPLARLEMRIGLRRLLDRFPALELADDTIERVPSVLFNRVASLRVRSPRPPVREP